MGVCAACLPTLQFYFRSKRWDKLASKARSTFSGFASGSKSTDSKNGAAVHMSEVVNTET